MSEWIDFQKDEHAPHYIETAPGFTNSKAWSAFDECRWLRDYHSREPEKCRALCRVYLSGARRWDRGIDVAQIMRQAAALAYGVR